VNRVIGKYKLTRFYCFLSAFFLVSGFLASAQGKTLALAPKIPTGECITVNGRPIYLEQFGKGRPLVLLHGGLATIQSSFNRQIIAFSKHHHVIAIEQTGHGHTPDTDSPFSYRQMADDTVGVLHVLKVRDADIVGWSDGGILALLIALHHPTLVHRLVVSGANTELVGMDLEESKKIQESSAKELAQDTSPVEKEAYGRISPDGPEHWPVVVKKAWNLWLTPVVIDKADLSRIQSPVLVVCGDNDVIPLNHTLEIFRSLPKSQLLVLPGTGHDTFNEAAATLNPIILAFLDSP